MFIIRRLFSVCLVLWLATADLVDAVWAGVPQNQLRIIVLKGQDSINDTRIRADVSLAVQVQDAAGSPASGAQVEFKAPDNGAGGAFANGSKTTAVMANQAGIAELTTFRPNGSPGTFEITVTASYQGVRGSAIIPQTNMGTPAGSPKKLIGILAGVGGAVAVLALRPKDQEKNTPLISVGPGITVGP
jgi:hypothetical protein